MDGQLIQKWMNSCRLCLLDDGIKMPIFGEEGIVREVAHKIQACLPIVLYNADPLSKIICQRCLFMLDTVYSFRQKCVETNSVFTSHLLALKNNSSSVKQYLQALDKNNCQPSSSNLVQQVSNSSPVPVIVAQVRESKIESQHRSAVKSKVAIEANSKPLRSLSASCSGNSDADPLANSSESHLPVIRIKQEGEKKKKSVPLIVSVVGSYSDNQPQNATAPDVPACGSIAPVPAMVSIKQEFRILTGKCRPSPRQVCTPWFCKPCNKYYKSKGTLYKHKKYFCPSKYFNCGKFNCNEEFETETERIQHWISHLRVHVFLRPEQLHSCDVCLKKFAYDSMLKNHMKIHNVESEENEFQKVRSPTVGVVSNQTSSAVSRPFPFNSYVARKSAFRSRSKGVGRRAFCQYCDRSYSRQTKLNWHVKICHKDQILAKNQYAANSISTLVSASNEPIPSSVAYSSEVPPPRENYRPAPLSKQKSKHQSDSPGLLRNLLQRKLKCSVCLKLFNTQQGLSNHMRSHGPKKIHRCLTCGRVFGSHKGLVYHTKTRHADCVSGNQDSYRCRPCSRSFQSRSEWLLHTLTHDKSKKESRDSDVDPLMDNAKLLLCSYCNQVFSQSSELKAHMMTHKVVPAPSSTSSTAPSADLRTRTWHCEICTKDFSTKRNLARHTKIHERRMHSSFPCQTCGKKFLSKSSALKHAAVHTLSKTFHCAACNKIFFRIEALHNHSCTPSGVVQTMIDTDVPTRDLPMEALPFEALPFEDQSLDNHLINQQPVENQPRNCLSCGFPHVKGHQCQYYQRDGTLLSYQVHKTFKSKVTTKKSSYTCKICGATFATCFSHNSHMKVHKKKHRPILKVPTMVKDNVSKSVHHDRLNEASSSASSGTFTPLDLRRLTSVDAASSSVEGMSTGSKMPELIPLPFLPDATAAGLKYLPPSSYFNHDGTLFDENEFYQCSVCTKTFHSEQGLSLHIKSHESTATKMVNTKITCPFCSRNYADAQAINQHILLNHPELSGIKE